jgi:hypothetical protein
MLSKLFPRDNSISSRALSWASRSAAESSTVTHDGIERLGHRVVYCHFTLRKVNYADREQSTVQSSNELGAYVLIPKNTKCEHTAPSKRFQSAP